MDRWLTKGKLQHTIPRFCFTKVGLMSFCSVLRRIRTRLAHLLSTSLEKRAKKANKRTLPLSNDHYNASFYYNYVSSSAVVVTSLIIISFSSPFSLLSPLFNIVLTNTINTWQLIQFSFSFFLLFLLLHQPRFQ